jgi:Archaeal PaREP1/PaREP8 family
MSNEDLLSEIKRRKELADYYYDNYRMHYQQKNFSKASEFLWGSTNALVYSLGLFYNKKLSEHKKIRDFIEDLANEYEDKDLAQGLFAAERIHANFFHDFMDEAMFEEDRQKIETMLVRLTNLLDKKIKSISA